MRLSAGHADRRDGTHTDWPRRCLPTADRRTHPEVLRTSISAVVVSFRSGPRCDSAQSVCSSPASSSPRAPAPTRRPRVRWLPRVARRPRAGRWSRPFPATRSRTRRRRPIRSPSIRSATICFASVRIRSRFPGNPSAPRTRDMARSNSAWAAARSARPSRSRPSSARRAMARRGSTSRPQVRFDPRKKVVLSLFVEDVAKAKDSWRILYCATATTEQCVDESLLDPSLAHARRREGEHAVPSDPPFQRVLRGSLIGDDISGATTRWIRCAGYVTIGRRRQTSPSSDAFGPPLAPPPVSPSSDGSAQPRAPHLRLVDAPGTHAPTRVLIEDGRTLDKLGQARGGPAALRARAAEPRRLVALAGVDALPVDRLELRGRCRV